MCQVATPDCPQSEVIHYRGVPWGKVWKDGTQYVDSSYFCLLIVAYHWHNGQENICLMMCL